MTNITGLTIEALVSVLLLLTILFCARLNRQLKQFKAGDGAMKTTIAELLATTEAAERAISGLRITVQEAEQTLGAQLRDAENFSTSFADTMQASEDLLHRLRKLAHAQKLLLSTDEPEERAPSRPLNAGGGVRNTPPARPAAPQKPDAQAMAAAAQALAERARSRGKGLAA